jgi:hypothetical protein
MSSTTRGTYQDTDGKWWEHYEVALQVYVHCVEMLREVAPVDCVHSMSNHDFQSGFHLAHALKSWFRKADDVSVDCGVANRKYYKFGSNLIGLEHGDGAKMDKLPLEKLVNIAHKMMKREETLQTEVFVEGLIQESDKTDAKEMSDMVKTLNPKIKLADLKKEVQDIAMEKYKNKTRASKIASMVK